MKWKTLAGVGLLIAISSSSFQVDGGYKDMFCTRNSSVAPMFSCEQDCWGQHGADGGQCGDVSQGDFNCYCGTPTRTSRYPNSQQCKAPSDNFRNFCFFDCLCMHGALGGHCDWVTNTCVCQGQGRNRQNKNCPAGTLEKYREIGIKYLGDLKYVPYQSALY